MKRRDKKSPIEERLIEEMELLQKYTEALWSFLPIPICDINGALIIINVGKRFLEFFGYKEEEIIGETIGKLFKSREEFKELKEELSKEGMIFQKEFTVLSRSKKEIPVAIFAAARREKDETVVSYFMAFIDLTEIKEKEKQLQEKIEELEKFQKIAIGRELKMVELKEEIENLKKRKAQAGKVNF